MLLLLKWRAFLFIINWRWNFLSFLLSVNSNFLNVRFNCTEISFIRNINTSVSFSLRSFNSYMHPCFINTWICSSTALRCSISPCHRRYFINLLPSRSSTRCNRHIQPFFLKISSFIHRIYWFMIRHPSMIISISRRLARLSRMPSRLDLVLHRLWIRGQRWSVFSVLLFRLLFVFLEFA